MHTQPLKKGFTLIELIVVIAIMGLLTSVILVSLTNARNKSNDTKRVADILQVRTALELYYNANNAYPITSGSSWQSQCVGWGGYSANNVIPGLVTGGYIPSFPSDPQMNASANTCCYIYRSNGTDYKLLEHQCPTGGQNAKPNAQPQLLDPARDGGTSCDNTGVIDGSAPWAWAVWSSTSSACW